MLDDVASLTLRTALAGLSQRQATTANNIANVETPGFSASQVDFESSLAAAVSSGDPAAARTSVTGTGDAAGVNGNNVSLEREMVNATKTTLQEQLMANALTTKYGYMSTVLKGV
ncbi:flagellar basal-body rod protein FlgB [Jatrophihabitans endophyticus]|uniref:Flagellar basal body rod protein FlgB n=1 Tax=Jatrophihabitans endophyticus TaxID=1206085 RepID=A0A1M5IFU0_9ACTN|nr:flagellar basal body protein [Jatrophihabitans endophyticus]SHG26790.1 flagellar basal-body rod protein FlgB [Jatrophihabitans endophyticus]